MYVSIPADAGSQEKGSDWRIIEHMGRGEGNAVEANAGCLKYSFYLMKSGEFTAEIFRFPTLNSVGRIRAAVRVDGGEEIIVESISNDEWRGTWKQNVMSNVDRLEFQLSYLAEGAHALEITAIDRYFTFSGIVIYTEERKPCYLAPRASYYQKPVRDLGDQKPTEEIPKLPTDFYDFTLSPRDTVYAGSKCWINNGLIDSNIRKPLAAYPQLDYTIVSGITCEQEGTIRIDAQSALAQDENAYIEGGEWEYADSETGLSMHIRQKGLRWNDLSQSPSLNYRINVSKPGNYHIWLLMKLNVEPTSVAFGLDGKPQPFSEQYNRGELWCYEAKQIWRWTPICDMEIPEGEHIFSIYAVTSEVRIDRVYMTQGEELPPDALEWQRE